MNSNPQEPTVLDWFKSLLKLKPIPIPESQVSAAVQRTTPKAPTSVEPFRVPHIGLEHFRFPAALVFAFIAQLSLERRAGDPWIRLALYILAAGLFLWALRKGEIPLPKILPTKSGQLSETFKARILIAGMLMAGISFLAAASNEFNPLTLSLWVGSSILVVASFWRSERDWGELIEKLKRWIASPRINISLDPWKLIFLGGLAVAAYFRFDRLATVPLEMTSDQAEKLLDLRDVLNGKLSIYFPRNTGREAIQFYLAAATSKILGTGISFMTLKVGTALLGLATLPFIYLFAKEYGGRWVGFAAMITAGIAYWPNVISRVGLRFPLYPLFVAPALFFLLRALRTRNRNDFLLCGISLGLGVHGYSPARLIPFVVAAGVGLYLLHRVSAGHRSRVLIWLGIAALIAIVIFLPLLRVALDMPDLFLKRILTRVAATEQALPGPPLQIFLSNMWDGIRMFNWDDGEIWVISISHRPALDWIMGALLVFGVIMSGYRYARYRNWQDLFLLVSVPLLMLPSTLSLAFPAENPAPNRASGVMVPIFTLVALPLAAIPAYVAKQWKTDSARIVGWGFAGALVLIAASTNYRLAVSEWGGQHRRGAWNTTDAGRIIGNFANSVGTYETSHVIRYPHWMDTRLVAIIAGRPDRDPGIWPDQAAELPDTEEAQLFLLKPEDQEGLLVLQSRFPDGVYSLWESNTLEGKDILIYMVPPKQGELNLGSES